MAPRSTGKRQDFEATDTEYQAASPRACSRIETRTPVLMAILRILWLALWRPAAGVLPAISRATRAGPARARARAGARAARGPGARQMKQPLLQPVLRDLQLQHMVGVVVDVQAAFAKQKHAQRVAALEQGQLLEGDLDPARARGVALEHDARRDSTAEQDVSVGRVQRGRGRSGDRSRNLPGVRCSIFQMNGPPMQKPITRNLSMPR